MQGGLQDSSFNEPVPFSAGRHTRSFGTFGDLYLTLVDGVLDLGVDAFPTATMKLPGILT